MLTELYVKLMVYVASLKNEEGQGMVEYALLLGIIALGVIVAVSAIGEQVLAKFEGLVGEF